MLRDNTEESQKTMAIDVRQNPKNWSYLASAILRTYHKDKEKNKSTYIEQQWYEDLLHLATRYTGHMISNNKEVKVEVIRDFYNKHSFNETCVKFGFTKNVFRYYLKKNKIRKQEHQKGKGEKVN